MRQGHKPWRLICLRTSQSSPKKIPCCIPIMIPSLQTRPPPGPPLRHSQSLSRRSPRGNTGHTDPDHDESTSTLSSTSPEPSAHSSVILSPPLSPAPLPRLLLEYCPRGRPSCLRVDARPAHHIHQAVRKGMQARSRTSHIELKSFGSRCHRAQAIDSEAHPSARASSVGRQQWCNALDMSSWRWKPKP